jgi:hypothetical protein
MKMTKLMELIRETINEELELESQAGDDAKRQGLEYLGFGRYGKDGKMTHKTVGGKLQPVKQGSGTPIKVSTKKPIGTKVADIGAGGKEMNVKTDATWDKLTGQKRFGPDTGYLTVRKGATPAQRKLVGKIDTMWDKVADNDFITKHMGKSYPAAEFEKMTGISREAAIAFTNAVADYESPFQYYSDDDTVYIADPMDV